MHEVCPESIQPLWIPCELVRWPWCNLAASQRRTYCASVNSHTVHKLSQWCLTADWLAPLESDCSQMHSKVSDWLPSYIHQGHMTGSRDIQNGWILSRQPSYKQLMSILCYGNPKVIWVRNNWISFMCKVQHFLSHIHLWAHTITSNFWTLMTYSVHLKISHSTPPWQYACVISAQMKIKHWYWILILKCNLSSMTDI
jgi:hypothetical protein